MACCGAGTSAPSGGEKDDFDEIKPVSGDYIIQLEVSSVSPIMEPSPSRKLDEPDDLEVDLQSSDALIEVLHHEDLRLIHGTYLQWLHEEQRAFPRRQDIEEKAFVSSLELEQWRLNKNEMQSRVRIICLSHVWECDQHPDPAGYQLEVLAKSQHWPASLSWYFIDFMSVSHLNRKDSMESLCPKYIYALYSHEKTFTYQITGFTPAAKFREALKSEVRAAYAFQDFSVIQGPTRLKHLILDDTPYLQRGWCLAEAQWSVMRSDPRRLVCLDSIEEHKAPMPPKMFQARVANGALRFRYFLDEEAIIYQQEKAFNQKAQSSTQLRLMKLPATEVLILAEALPFYVRLTKLSLSKCRLSVRVLTALAKGLEEHALRDLDLRDNAMNDASANGIAEIFRTNHHLKRVDLRQNSFSPAGAKAIASGLTDNSHVSELILRENQIQCHGASILAEALRFNDALEFLDVSFNQIRDDGAMAFAIALPDNQSLRTLNLAENLITSACLPSWATYLSSGQCRLQQLRFDGNLIDVDAEAAKVLEDSWHEGQRAGTQHLPSICGLGEIEDRVKQRLDRTWNSHASGPSSAAAAYVEFCRRPVLLAAMPCLPEACFYFASLQAEPSWDSPAGWVIAGALLVTFIVVCFHFVLELNSNARKACSSLALHLDLASALGAVIAALANALWTLPLCDTIPEAAACYSLSFVGLFALVLQQVRVTFTILKLLRNR
ncbi:LRR and CARD domains-containing protein 3) (Nucleotide-binding oligomerization domain protein 3) [Durusdinium trenchii]